MQHTAPWLAPPRAIRQQDPFLVAGDRAYLIGAQDGSFPDLGWHVQGEMGGLWVHPIKLADGLWLAIDGAWLPSADRFLAGPASAVQEWDLPEDLSLSRRLFVPDSEPALAIRHTLRSPRDRSVHLRLLVRTDLRDVWRPESSESDDAPNTARFDSDLSAWLCRHPHRPWHLAVGTDLPAEVHHAGHDLRRPEQTAGNGISVALDVHLHLRANRETSLNLILAGAEGDESEVVASFRRVRGRSDALLEAKQTRLDAHLARSRLDVPDATLNTAWTGAQCTLDWMLRDVPGTGRGLGAGMPDYPWWFGCDTCYSALGCLALGRADLAIMSLDLVRALSEQANAGNGRVIHETTTRGETFNPGNVQETPQFTATVWEVFRWTGDRDFLARNYDFCRRGLLDWTVGACSAPGDVLPRGSGIVEIPGLDARCLDAAVYTAVALEALAGMAVEVGDDATAARAQALHLRTLDRLDDFWLEDEGLYGDVLATPAEMLPRLHAWQIPPPDAEFVYHPDAAPRAATALLPRAEHATDPGRECAWPLLNAIVVLPAVLGLATPERAIRTLDRLEGPEFASPWGMYLNGRDHTSTMSINSGLLAEAELRYGRVGEGLRLLHLLATAAFERTPGAISECLPDTGCFVQTWSTYALAWPLAAHLFGLRPEAHRRHLSLHPHFPPGWAGARLRHVPLGDSRFDFRWDGATLHVAIAGPHWTVEAGDVPLEVTHTAILL